MNLRLRVCGVLLLLAWLPGVQAQQTQVKVVRVDVKHVGPPSASDALLRSNIRVKVGDTYHAMNVDDDVRSLYATGQFYNIRVNEERTDGGIALTYVVQGKPLLTDI